MSNCHHLFVEAFDRCTNITTVPMYCDVGVKACDTHTFDSVMYSVSENKVELAPGETAKCMTVCNRRLLIIGTRFGNILIFEKFQNGEGGRTLSNCPDKVDPGTRIFRGNMSENAFRMSMAVGNIHERGMNENYGEFLERRLNRIAAEEAA